MNRFFNRRNVIIILLVIFIFFRIYVDYSTDLLAHDKLKFIEAGNNFPNHTLYNNQLYLLHPPVYPYAIYLSNFIFEQDHIASIFISLISSIVSFFIIYHFFMLITKNFKLTFFILVLYTLSDSLIIASRIALRESFLIMLILLSLYFYVKGVKNSDNKSLILATIFGSILSLTSDHVVLLIPALGISYIFMNKEKVGLFKFPKLKHALIPLIIILLFYGSWTLVKYVQYEQSDFYPNGHSGIPLNTQKVGLLQTINPEFFEDFEGAYITPGFLSVVKRVGFNLGYMFNLQPFSVPRGLNFTTMKFLLKPIHILYMIFIYMPLALIMLYGMFKLLKNLIVDRKIHNNVNLYVIGLFLIFVFPLSQQLASPRYILTAYIFFYYFIAFGILALIKNHNYIKNKIIPIVLIILFLFVPVWFVYNSNFVLFVDKSIRAQNTGDFVKANIPGDAGIMAQPGFSVELSYLTDNRVIGLHPDPDRLATLIDFYDIEYIIFGRYYTYDAYHISKDSAEYVMNNPDKFELIGTVDEDYSEFYSEDNPASSDEVWVYKVLR